MTVDPRPASPRNVISLRLEREPSLTETTATRLARAIYLGHFVAGHHLGEVQLSKEIGVGRSILREAFRMLAAEGLVEIRRNHGAYVIDPSADDIEQMSVFRAVTEGLAARLLVSRRDEGSLARLDAIVRDLEEASDTEDRIRFLDLHWQFHQAICEESGNKFLVQSWNSVSRIIRMYQQQTLSHVRLLHNNKLFAKEFRCSTPARAEQLIRGQIIKTAYGILGRPIAKAVQPYVTLHIGEDGTVQRFRAGKNAG